MEEEEKAALVPMTGKRRAAVKMPPGKKKDSLFPEGLPLINRKSFYLACP